MTEPGPPCRNPPCPNRLQPGTRGRKWKGARGYCVSCYKRGWKTGVWPPVLPSREEMLAATIGACHAAQRERAAEALEDYCQARSWGFTVHEAAVYAGRSEDWARRVYEPAYQASRARAA